MHHKIVNTDISQGDGIVSGAGKCFFSKDTWMKIITFSRGRHEKGSLQNSAPVEL